MILAHGVRVKERAVVLALRAGLGLARVECCVYGYRRDGSSVLVARALRPDLAWAAALDVLEAMAPTH